MRRAAVLAVTSLALAVAACTGDGVEPSGGPSRDRVEAGSPLRWHDCPAEVEVSFLSPHRCGTLVVPRDRNGGAGTLDLAVIQVWPVGVEPRDGLATGFAANLGDPRIFSGGTAAGATRLRSVVVELAFRGTDPSSPALTCPEVDALAVRAAGLPDDDDGLRRSFLRAVSDCAARHRGEGIEPADFDTAAAAADLEDLRVAMGVDSWWGAGSYGTQSRVLFRYLSDYPGRLEAAWLDSPWYPGTDDLAGGALGTRSALAELFGACSADDQCAARYPRLQQAWKRALSRTDASPLTGRGERRGKGRVDVVVDDAKLLRFVRYSLGGEGTGNLSWLPRIITDAAAGRLHPHLADLVASDPPFCAGYRPQCLNMERFALGVYLTSLCKEQVPALDEDTLRHAVAGDAASEQVFLRSPYLEACEFWDTPGDPPPPMDTSSAALLLIPGQFDSFSRPEWSQTHAAASEHAWTFTAPNNTHNTLGYDECALSVRNAWVDAPLQPPDPALCTSPPKLTFR